MATWKKVAVSGSNISQFNNDAGYLTSVTTQAAFATASFNGTALIANDANGNLSFASSSNQGLTISASAGTDTLTFGLSAIPNASLSNSTISGKALGTNLDDLTIGNGLAASSNYNGSAARTVAVGAGTHITVNTNDVAVNTTTLVPAISGSIFSQVSGDITITSAGVATIAANAVALATDISGFGGGVAAVLAVNTGSAGSVVVNGGALGTPSSGTLTNATGLPISGLVSSTSTALGVGSLELGHASDTTFTRVSSGVAAIEGNNIITANNFGANVLTFLGTPSSANLAAAVTDETGTGTLVFSAGPTLTGTTNVASLAASGNVTITGDLSVAGTASFTNTDNLNIRDKFILLNSGSSTLADSGWVTQYNAAGSGSAFYLEAASSGTFGRFAVAYDVIGTSTSLTVDEYAVTAKIGQASAPGATTPTWGGATNGTGNMWVTTAGDIFIYS